MNCVLEAQQRGAPARDMDVDMWNTPWTYPAFQHGVTGDTSGSKIWTEHGLDGSLEERNSNSLSVNFCKGKFMLLARPSLDPNQSSNSSHATHPTSWFVCCSREDAVSREAQTVPQTSCFHI
jgi:hypothetical protein